MLFDKTSNEQEEGDRLSWHGRARQNACSPVRDCDRPEYITARLLLDPSSLVRPAAVGMTADNQPFKVGSNAQAWTLSVRLGESAHELALV